MTVTKARTNLLPLVDEVAKFGKTITLTKNGVPKVALVASDELKGLLETIAIMSDRKLYREVKEGLAEIKKGELGTPLSEIKKMYNIK